MTICKNHPDIAGPWTCRFCGGHFCAPCATRRPDGIACKPCAPKEPAVAVDVDDGTGLWDALLGRETRALLSIGSKHGRNGPVDCVVCILVSPIVAIMGIMRIGEVIKAGQRVRAGLIFETAVALATIVAVPIVIIVALLK